MARSEAFDANHCSASSDSMFRVVFGELTGLSFVIGFKVAVLSFSTISPGFIPGADAGGGPLLLTGVSTFTVTGLSVAVFVSVTTPSFLIGIS